MKKFSSVNWSMLIGGFIVETVSRLEAEELLSKIEREILKIFQSSQRGVSLIELGLIGVATESS